MLAYVVGKYTGLKKIPIPIPNDGEALIKVLRAGICNTDLEILKGYAGFSGVLGHEFVGQVVEINHEEKERAEVAIKVGDIVNGEINLRCDACDICRLDNVRSRNHCPRRTVLGIINKNGTYAEYLTLPLRNLFKVPNELSLAEACFTEPLAAACRILEQNLVHKDSRVLVIGDGKLGLLCALVIASQKPSSVTCIGKHKAKLAKLPVGVDCRLLTDDSKTEMFEKFDVVVEATGTPQGLMFAANCCEPLGTIVLKSTCAAAANTFDSTPFVVKELSIIGSRCGPFDAALRLMEKKVIEVEPLLVKTYPFEDVEKALDHARTKGTLKVQLVMAKQDIKL